MDDLRMLDAYLGQVAKVVDALETKADPVRHVRDTEYWAPSQAHRRAADDAFMAQRERERGQRGRRRR